MAWLSMLIQGFKIASTILDLFKSIQAQREFISKMDGITAEQRVKLLLEISAEEDRLRSISDPATFRAETLSRIDAIVKRALSALPGTVVKDALGVGPTPTSPASSPPATGGV